MKVFGWLADHSGCGWYRIALPLDQIRGFGAETMWSNRLTEDAWEADVLVCQRVCLPGPTGLLQRIAKHKGRRPKLVFELDDNLWQIDPSSNPLTKQFFDHPEIRQNLIDNIKACDAVTVSTEPLAAVVRQWNPDVTVLPNTVHQDLLQWRHGRYLNRFTLGWQGSPTHDDDWKVCSPHVERWFRSAVKRDEPVEFHTIGSLPAGFPGIYPHRHTDWRETIQDYYRTVDFDVALAPLKRSVFNDSKSDIRVLEAAAMGIPVIASNVRAYRDTVVHEQTGFLVEKPGDWGRFLTELANEPEMRKAMERNARVWAGTRTTQSQAHLWMEAYR